MLMKYKFKLLLIVHDYPFHWGLDNSTIKLRM